MGKLSKRTLAAIVAVAVIAIGGVAYIFAGDGSAAIGDGVNATPKRYMNTDKVGNMTVGQFMLLCQEGTVEEVEAAIKGGSDVNGTNDLDDWPILKAINGNSDPGVVIALIDAGADVNLKNNNGKKAIDVFPNPVPEELKEVYAKIKAATTAD